MNNHQETTTALRFGPCHCTPQKLRSPTQLTCKPCRMPCVKYGRYFLSDPLSTTAPDTPCATFTFAPDAKYLATSRQRHNRARLGIHNHGVGIHSRFAFVGTPLGMTMLERPLGYDRALSRGPLVRGASFILHRFNGVSPLTILP